MANAISNFLIPQTTKSGIQTTTPMLGTGGGGLFGSLLGLNSRNAAMAPTTLPTKPSPVTAPITGLVSPANGVNFSQPKAPVAPLATANVSGGSNTVGGLISSPNIGSSLSTAGTSGNPYTYNASTGWGINNGGTATNPVQPTSPTRGLFGSVATSLAAPSQNTMTTEGYDNYQKAVKDLADFRKSEAAQIGAIDSSPTSARVMQGRAAAVQQANAEKEAALAQAVTQTQNEIGFGQAQQGLNQQALSTVAGLVKPSPTSYGQTVFNPETGTFTGGSGNLDPQTAASSLASQVIAGKMTYDQAVSSLGYAGSAGQQFLNSAIQTQSPGFNIPAATASTLGAANVLGSIPAMQSANTAAEGIQNKIVSYLSSNPQLNPSKLAVGNTLQQWIQGKQLTDPTYQTLFNYLNEYTNTLAPILGVGGDPTNLKTQIAQGFINAAASGQSITSVLQNMQALAAGKIQDLASGAQGGGVVSSPSTPSSGDTGGGGLYHF